MKVNEKFTILVNSCDGFSDCWEPFFKLFTIYWPNCNVKVLLNTEVMDWSFPGLDIQCTQVDIKKEKLTWSECLIKALEQVDTPLIMYLQEDYFLEKNVDDHLIFELVDIMISDTRIKHIGLTHFGSFGPFYPTADQHLWKVDQKARYRISTQAGLWRTDTLLTYLKPEENGWMFEIYGTRRARKRDECFLTTNRDIHCPEKTPIFQYTHTGIIKGKWHKNIPQLFARHNIEVNFEKRGFYKEPYWLVRKATTLIKLISSPVDFLRGMGLLSK